MRAVEGEDDKRTTRGRGAWAPPERGSQEGSSLSVSRLIGTVPMPSLTPLIAVVVGGTNKSNNDWIARANLICCIVSYQREENAVCFLRESGRAYETSAEESEQYTMRAAYSSGPPPYDYDADARELSITHIHSFTLSRSLALAGPSSLTEYSLVFVRSYRDLLLIYELVRECTGIIYTHLSLSLSLSLSLDIDIDLDISLVTARPS